MDELLYMSNKELSRLDVMKKLDEKRMRQQEAATMLGISTRQVKRLLRAYRLQGAKGLVSKRRGRVSNNQLEEKVVQKALKLLHGKYRGFGPTLAHEKLVELEGLNISDESVRQLMIGEDLWKPKKARKVVTHQMRERRASFGELVQIDGSPHDWFEGRAPSCTLLVFMVRRTEPLSMMPPASWVICNLWRARAFSAMPRLRRIISACTASLWRSTVTNTAFFGSNSLRWAPRAI